MFFHSTAETIRPFGFCAERFNSSPWQKLGTQSQIGAHSSDRRVVSPRGGSMVVLQDACMLAAQEASCPARACIELNLNRTGNNNFYEIYAQIAAYTKLCGQTCCYALFSFFCVVCVVLLLQEISSGLSAG